MPTYVVHLNPHASSTDTRTKLARRIGGEHSRFTGATPSFTQVIIRELGVEHFIGGEPADPRSAFVHGHIRDGRTREAKDALIGALRDVVRDTLDVPQDLVWVYLSEIPAPQMVEFGHVLPAPGDERAWQAALPDDTRAHLTRLDTRRGDS